MIIKIRGHILEEINRIKNSSRPEYTAKKWELLGYIRGLKKSLEIIEECNVITKDIRSDRRDIKQVR